MFLGNLAKSRFPSGRTERKARATTKAGTKEEADPCGMTARKAKARTKEDAYAQW
jgi:hypothetical protein